MPVNSYLSALKYYLLFGLLALGCINCQQAADADTADRGVSEAVTDSPVLIVLGIAQDAGYPQAGCQKACCAELWVRKEGRKMVSCLGLIDPISEEAWLFDATPDFRDQLQLLEQEAPLRGIFLTHAHIGHYTGLMQLGREVMGSREVPVYAMPRMADYLANNGPWGQLVHLQNISIQGLAADSSIQLNERISVQPFLVPHRDEYSETVGYRISGPKRSAIFIPDIDKWHKWDRSISEQVRQNDLAFLDGSFYQDGEIPGRDMRLIPHPFIMESLEEFEQLAPVDRSKIHFIHFNHTNPLLRDQSLQQSLQSQHFGLAQEGSRFPL